MLPTRGLLRDANGRWFHISSRQSTVVLRPVDGSGPEQRYSDPEASDLERMIQTSEIYSVGRIVAELAGIMEIPPRGFKHTEVARWQEVIAALEEARSGAPEPAANSLLVPVSRLRRFYETLRLVNTVPVHGAIADHLARDPDRADMLDTLFAESVRHVERYANVDQHFHQGTGRDWFVGYGARPDQFARSVVAAVAPSQNGPTRVAIPGADLRYSAVDYEISPLRTAGGHQYEDGRPASSSGAGGVDLLLATDDGVPVVGEVKAPADTSLFVALVQALTYAVEILTPSQSLRLSRAYPAAFRETASPVCEILILIAAGDRPLLEEQTRVLIRHLLGDPDRAIARFVRRITIVEAKLGGSAPTLALRYSEPSSYHSPSESSRTG